MPSLTIVLASTRPGRAGASITEWFVARAAEHEAFDIRVVDLAELGLPLLDEPNHPRLRQYINQHTLDWSEIVDASDAFVFVTPEYNHGYPASLKNALDYLHAEWADKPAAFVSYGGVSGGTRAVQQLKPVLLALRMTPIVEGVTVPFFATMIDEEGAFRPNELIEQSADATLTELARLDGVLSRLRALVA